MCICVSKIDLKERKYTSMFSIESRFVSFYQLNKFYSYCSSKKVYITFVVQLRCPTCFLYCISKLQRSRQLIDSADGDSLNSITTCFLSLSSKFKSKCILFDRPYPKFTPFLRLRQMCSRQFPSLSPVPFSLPRPNPLGILLGLLSILQPFCLPLFQAPQAFVVLEGMHRQ